MRPTLAPERRLEMLEALADCVAEFGIHGATSGRVAERAGWTRGLVRHYLGNRDAQFEALVGMLMERHGGALEEAIAASPPGERRRVVIDTLFGVTWQSGRDRDDIVLAQLVAYESLHAGGSRVLTDMYRALGTSIHGAMQSDLPDLDPERGADIAYTVVCLAYGASSMSDLGWRDRTAAPRRVAEDLLMVEVERVRGA